MQGWKWHVHPLSQGPKSSQTSRQRNGLGTWQCGWRRIAVEATEWNRWVFWSIVVVIEPVLSALRFMLTWPVSRIHGSYSIESPVRAGLREYVQKGKHMGPSTSTSTKVIDHVYQYPCYFCSIPYKYITVESEVRINRGAELKTFPLLLCLLFCCPSKLLNLLIQSIQSQRRIHNHRKLLMSNNKKGKKKENVSHYPFPLSHYSALWKEEAWVKPYEWTSKKRSRGRRKRAGE